MVIPSLNSEDDDGGEQRDEFRELNASTALDD
jgi:hypothetical protein